MSNSTLNTPSAIKQMEYSSFPAIAAPFNGKIIWIIARELNYVQIKSCGDFSLIETMQDKINNKELNKKLSFDDMVKYSELQHKIVSKSLLNPSYDQIINMLNKYDDSDNIDEQLKNIKNLFDEAKKDKNSNKKEMKLLKEEYAMIELQYRFILPADFLSFIFSYALKINDSDINLVSEEMLYNAAVKAKLGKDNPSDHLSGNFTKFNLEDINDRAWNIYYEKHKDNVNKPKKRRA